MVAKRTNLSARQRRVRRSNNPFRMTIKVSILVYGMLVLSSMALLLCWTMSIKSMITAETLKDTHHARRVETKLKEDSKSVMKQSTTQYQEQLFTEEDRVVHVITTRFMQSQPYLLELGLARLELFKALCLPTILQQSSFKFLWIIRADPNLAPSLRKSLLQILSNATANNQLNVVVVGSNQNPSGLRDNLLVNDQTEVWTGNYQLLQDYHEAAQTRIVLETRLDADDGLNLDFAMTLQQEAIRQLSSTSEQWIIWCPGAHLEWQYNLPWGDDANNGDYSSPGSLMPGTTYCCPTPGLTKGYSIGTSFSSIPTAPHHKLHTLVPRCSEKGNHDNHHNVDTDYYSTQCLLFWTALLPTAIRGRTFTSAGMQNIVGKDNLSNSIVHHIESIHENQDELWDIATLRFGLSKQNIVSMHQYLRDHQHAIVLDAYQGQCTKGHSCKQSSKEFLRDLINKTKPE